MSNTDSYEIPGLSRVTLQVFHENSSHWQLAFGGDLASQLGAKVERLCVLSRQPPSEVEEAARPGAAPDGTLREGTRR